MFKPKQSILNIYSPSGNQRYVRDIPKPQNNPTPKDEVKPEEPKPTPKKTTKKTTDERP